MDITNYIKDIVRSGGVNMQWLDAHRMELAPLLLSRLRFLLDGVAFVVIADDERAWFERYFLGLINARGPRPLLPFFSIDDITRNLSSDELINDLLSIAFPNGYVFIYIGRDSGKKFQLAKSRSESLLIMFDSEYDNAFTLSSADENRDFKLLGLARLINATVDGLIFSRFELD